MGTQVTFDYESKVFPKGQYKQFALKLARYCNTSPSDGHIILHRKDDGFDTRTESTVDELDNIPEIDISLQSIGFHYQSHFILLSLKDTLNDLYISYILDGDLDFSRKLIFFTENTLGLTRIDPGVKNYLGQRIKNMHQPCIDTDTGSDSSNEPLVADKTVQSIEPSMEEISFQVGGECSSHGNLMVHQFHLEIDEPLFELMRQVYERDTKNTVGGTFEKYFNLVIQSHCQKMAGT